MRDKRLTLSESLAIEWVKSEEELLRQEPELFDIEAEQNQSGEILHPYQYLAQRAERYLALRGNGDESRFRCWGHVFFWVPVVLAVILGGLVYSAARVESILGNGLVSLAGSYFSFLILQMIFFVVSAFSLLYLFGRWVTAWFRKGKDSASKFHLLTFCSGLVGTVLIWGNRLIGSGISAFFHKKMPNREYPQQPRSGFWTRLMKQDRSLLFFAGFLSHLFWLSLAIVVLFFLFVRMMGNRYDYCWNSSLFGPQAAMRGIEFFAAPIDGLISPPNEEQFHWLFENSTLPSWEKSITIPPVSSRDPEEAARIRQYWSKFLLVVVFCWAVCPRLVLALIYYFLYRWSLRDLIPKLDDPYYVRLLERAKGVMTQIRETAPADVEPDKLGDLTLKEKMPDAGLQTLSAEEPNIPEEPLPPKRTVSILCSYDLAVSSQLGEKILDSGPDRRFFGDLAKRGTARESALAELTLLSETASRLVLFLNATQSPARQTERFLLEKIFQPVRQASLFAVLSCGERLRRKLDAEGVQTRLDDWRRSIQQIGKSLETEITVIDYYDHELDLADSRRRLAEQLTEGLPSGKLRKIAGKFGEARSIILTEIDSLAENRSGSTVSDSLTKTLRTGYDRLLALYREDLPPKNLESVSLGGQKFGLQEKLTASVDSLRSLADKAKTTIDPDGMKEKLASALTMVDSIKDFTKKLSPKSALIFGSAGLTLPFLPILLPAAGSAAGVGTIMASLGTLIPVSITSAGIGAAAGAVLPAGGMALRKRLRRILPFGSATTEDTGAEKAEDSAHIPDGEDDLSAAVETAALSLTGWGVLFELQQFSGSERGDLWAELLRPFESASVTNSERVAAVLTLIEDQLRALSEPNQSERNRNLSKN